MPKLTKEQELFNSLVPFPKRKHKAHEKKSYWIKQNDTMFSLIIRQRDNKCMRCKSETNKLDCSHVIPRTNKSLRWNMRNAITLCFRCHLPWWHGSPTESAEWYKKTFPEDHKYLQKIVKENRKAPSLHELKEIYIKLKSML